MRKCLGLACVALVLAACGRDKVERAANTPVDARGAVGEDQRSGEPTPNAPDTLAPARDASPEVLGPDSGAPDARAADAVERDAGGSDLRSVDAVGSDSGAADVRGTDAAAICGGEYVACGCGCCGGTGDTAVPRCYYPDLGESVASVTAADLQTKADPKCAMAGCSLGMRYVCCPAAVSSPTDSATYQAEGYIGGLNRIRITKMGNPICVDLTLTQPGSGATGAFRVDVPATWGVQAATRARCTASSPPPQAIGASGQVSLRRQGAACVLDVHATTFFLAADGSVQTERLDADGLEIKGASAGMCP